MRTNYRKASQKGGMENVDLLEKCLVMELGEEMKKNEKNIDLKKVSRISLLLEECDINGSEIDRNRFAKNFYRKYNVNLQPSKRRAPRYLKAAAIILFVLSVFIASETIAVKAYGVSIIDWVRTATGMLFEFSVDDGDMELSTDYDDFEEITPNRASNFEELAGMLGVPFYVPGYLPEGFSIEEIYYNELNNSINAVYFDGSDGFLYWRILFPIGNGSQVIDIGDHQIVENDLIISDFEATIYQQNETEGYFAAFIYNNSLYTIETSAPVSEIIKIIEEVKIIK